MNAPTLKAKNIESELISLANPDKAKFLQRFFKTGPGQYAEGDKFLGLTVPQSRLVVKKFKSTPLPEIAKLITSKYHEVRVVALGILCHQFSSGQPNTRSAIYSLYLQNTKHINNWDLVDISAPNIVGEYLYERKNIDQLLKLASSSDLWERRIAILSTFAFLKHGDSKPTYQIAEILLHDQHDLIHKAVGWLLREAGKRVSREELEKFLETRAHNMPRTMLRYSLEHFPPNERQKFMSMKQQPKI